MSDTKPIKLDLPAALALAEEAAAEAAFWKGRAMRHAARATRLETALRQAQPAEADATVPGEGEAE